MPRDLVMSIKGPDAPIVIVGNKTDAERVISKVIIYTSNYVPI